MISVIMSTFREPIEYIRCAVDSIMNQTYQDIEFIIIVDDPENKGIISYLRDLENKDNRIIVSVNEKNCGLAESLNKAIMLSHGEYIARMDADDISEPDRLESELNLLLDKELDLVGCNICDIDEQGKLLNSAGTNYPTADNIIKKYLKADSAIPHPTWMVRREVYINSGMYQKFPAAQDYEFLTRIALENKKLGNVKEPKLRYRINGAGISSKKKVLQKTIQYYVRQNYRNGKKSSLKEFGEFLNSIEGEKKRAGLQKYYQSSAKLKLFLAEKKYFSFFAAGIITFMLSKEGRLVVFGVLNNKILKLKHKYEY